MSRVDEVIKGMPEISTFEIFNVEDGASSPIVVEGGARFAHERDLEDLWDCAKDRISDLVEVVERLEDENALLRSRLESTGLGGTNA